MLEKWTIFETLLTALIISDLFDITSPISVYLQSKTLDYLKAWSLVHKLLEQIERKRNGEKFSQLYEKCGIFTKSLNNIFKNQLDIENDFIRKRIAIKKKMPGEKASDESSLFSPHTRFRVTYFEILDTAKQSIQERFVPNKGLLLDCSWLDPQRYSEISNLDITEIPSDVFGTISELTNIDRNCLILELKQFSSQYDSFNKTRRELYKKCGEKEHYSDSEGESDTESSTKNIETHCKKFQKCSKCLPCAFSLLYELSQHSGLFNNLYTALKFVLTLPCTQVSCERTFSKLKIIKTRLRSIISQDLLSSLIFMYTEKDLFKNIDKNKIINLVASSSEELRLKLSL